MSAGKKREQAKQYLRPVFFFFLEEEGCLEKLSLFYCLEFSMRGSLDFYDVT
jgi:hypothetical protein